MLSFFPLDVLDEIWDLIESVSEGFLNYSKNTLIMCNKDCEHTKLIPNWVKCVTSPAIEAPRWDLQINVMQI